MPLPHELTLGIIPARFASSRFPGKPLHLILGKSLIQRTYENAKSCSAFDEVVIATDDQRIFNHIHSFGGKVIMTSPQCLTGTDRIAEVLKNNREYDKYAYVVNIQGDEPCVPPLTFHTLIRSIKTSNAEIVTPVIAFYSEEEAFNRNIVKCVMDRQGYALYFSRALIPAGKTNNLQPGVTYYRHIGLYAFKRSLVLKFVELPSTPLQLAEDLEQLKLIELGIRIKLEIVTELSIDVNTPEDITKIENYLCQQNISS